MSAITGIFYRDGRTVKPDLIEKMNGKLSHRGPDGSAVWVDGPVALGHQMLWTTTESLREKLPFDDEKTGLVITADARIDNRKDLSEELDIEDKEDISDSYFILKSYEKWGEKCPEYLLGDFAFAIWDENDEKLFCARDHMGVKPFYYYLNDNMFVFGTEIKALFGVPGVPYELNELKLAMYLTINTLDRVLTFYEDILRLIPAYCLTITHNGTKIENYWELDPESQILMDSDEEYALKFREIFTEAVQCRLRSAYPIGFELSGGLDSSSVVCMAREIIEKKKLKLNLSTFSYVFDDFPEVDERYYINKVLDSFGINHHFIYGDNISTLKNMDTILWQQEQPFYTPNMSIIWNLRRKMNEKNIRVLLSGDGGDELVSQSTGYLNELAVTMHWKKLFTEIYEMSKHRNINLYKLFFIHFIFPLIPEQFKKIITYKRKKDMFTKDGTFILNQEFINRLGGEKYLKDLKWQSFDVANSTKKRNYLTLTSDQYVLDMNDKLSSSVSIEHRYPYYDKRLIEFCFALPNEMKFKFGWNRFIQRVAMNNILPFEIQWRSQKTNFNPIYERNLLLEKNYLEKILFDDKTLERYLDLDKIREIYKNYINGLDVTNDKFAVWLALLLFIWLQKSKLL